MTISFSLVDICVEGHYMDQLRTLFINAARNIIPDNANDAQPYQKCDSKQFSKLQKSHVRFDRKKNDNDSLMEIILVQDPQIT